MAKNIICFVTMICFLFVVTGCASIVSGRTQRLSVISNPSTAIATVAGQKQLTPATFILDKHGDYVVRVEKEGYQPVEIALRRGISGWVFGNILLFPWLGTVIGVIIDITTGSATKLTPSPIKVDLVEQRFGSTQYPLRERPVLEEKPKEERLERIVAEDTRPTTTTYADYYSLLYKTVSSAVVKPESSGNGVINVAFTLLSDGTLEEVNILEGSSGEPGLRNAVEKAIRDSAPFPPFSEDIKAEGKKTFTISIEFRN